MSFNRTSTPSLAAAAKKTRPRSSSSSAFLLVVRREILVNTKGIICKLRSKIMTKLRGAGDRFGDYL